jgi:hypothetical protein
MTLTNDQAYDLVMKVATGGLDQVEEIAAVPGSHGRLPAPASL